MLLRRDIIFLLVLFLGANQAWGVRDNPCFDAATEHCAGLEGDDAHYCLARIRNRLTSTCTERVETYYREKKFEALPETEDDEKIRTESEKMPANYGLPWWQDPNAAPRKAPKAKVPPSTNTEGVTPDMYDPYFNLRNMMNSAE